MEIQKILESLSPNERKIIPFLHEKSISEICKKSNLDKISVLRALEYLQNKNAVKLDTEKREIAELGVNGSLYKKKGLPERNLLNLLDKKRILSLQEAQKESKLSPDEFKASIGVLKRKNLIDLKNGKIIFNANKEEISKKSYEENLLEILPVEINSLSQEQKEILKLLKERKNMVEIREEKRTNIEITELGEKLRKSKIDDKNLVEQITPETLKKDSYWKGKKFRRYDVSLPTPSINGGKRHFVNQSIEYGKKVWTEMGFKEMNGDMVVSSFWNFDALFTAQDHPVREMQDTFFLKSKSELPEKEIVKQIKESHEGKLKSLESKGWGEEWKEESAKKTVLRTHTTCVSAQNLKEVDIKNLPVKLFAIGKCFRNETVDWSHGFEFNQSEGIVVDRKSNFRHLLGYLKQFFTKMGFEKIRMRPAYFPYTEPSVEIDVWHPEKKKWLELGGAGIFRPEVVVPLLGENIPVLAWGPGFDRMLMDYYEIKDLRELYKNDLTKLRKMKFWIK